MASRSGQVTIRGRFTEGQPVHLTKVKDESVQRPEGGQLVDTKKVKDGQVQFKTGVDDNARYIAWGYVRGEYVTVRARGRTDDTESEVLTQTPPQPDRMRLADGTWEDEAPDTVDKKDLPRFEAAPNLAQTQVPKGTPQRSDTPRGSAHPVDTDEPAPYRSQEDVPKGTLQMSDTPQGAATEIALGPQRQEDVPKNVWQRSSTPTGVATVIPQDGPVEAQQEKESSRGKEMRGEPVRVATEPISGDVKAPTGANEKKSDERQKEAQESIRETLAGTEVATPTPSAANDRDNLDGLDAQGQPADEGVAASLGIKPADKPAESGKRPAKRKPAKRKPAKKPAAEKPAAEKPAEQKPAEQKVSGRVTLSPVSTEPPKK